MADSVNNDNSKQHKKKRKAIRVHKLPPSSSTESVSSKRLFCAFLLDNSIFVVTYFLKSDDDQSYLPPAAKDSGWIDLQVHDPISSCSIGDDEDLIQIIGEETESKPPILLLFPGLKEINSNNETIGPESECTANMIRTLVGQKPDFSFLKNANQLKPTKVDRKSNVF